MDLVKCSGSSSQVVAQTIRHRQQSQQQGAGCVGGLHPMLRKGLDTAVISSDSGGLT
jgi:hypothetical protein